LETIKACEYYDLSMAPSGQASLAGASGLALDEIDHPGAAGHFHKLRQDLVL
jgi:hypothetical protein